LKESAYMFIKRCWGVVLHWGSKLMGDRSGRKKRNGA